MHQRTGRVWKVFIPFVLLLFGLVLGVLVYPTINELYHHSVAANPTPFVPFANPASQTRTPTPTAQVQSYITGLSSDDPRIFTKAFSEALVHRDTANLSKHKDDQFLEICQSSENAPDTETPACLNSWDTLTNQLATDAIELSVNPSAPMTMYYASADGETSGVIIGQYTNNNNSDMPLVHIGTAKFWFSERNVRNKINYIWSTVILWPTVQ